VTDGRPLDVGELVRRLGSNPPFRLLDVARGFLGAADKIEAVNLLLVDYGQELLRPFGAYQGRRWGRSGSTRERPAWRTVPRRCG
jgi:hypothetical protein